MAVVVTAADGECRIRSDEEVIFFNTFGSLSEDRSNWVIPIHGWIFEPEKDSKVRNKILERFRHSLTIERDAAKSAIFNERARPFLVDNERWKKVSIRLGNKIYTLDRSRPNGHFGGTVRLSTDDAQRLWREQRAQAGWIRFQAVLPPADRRVFSGSFQLIEETGVSVISDIDDTIKVTNVPDRVELLANTFLRKPQAIAGMANVYQTWATSGAAFHYVSTNPWQLYEFLTEYLHSAGFPEETMHLKIFRWVDASFLNLFASPEVTKRKDIERILSAFPRRRFILVGDSGEKDPELYGAVARRHTGQVVRIFIRDITGEGANSKRFRKAFRGLPAGCWSVFVHADELASFKP